MQYKPSYLSGDVQTVKTIYSESEINATNFTLDGQRLLLFHSQLDLIAANNLVQFREIEGHVCSVAFPSGWFWMRLDIRGLSSRCISECFRRCVQVGELQSRDNGFEA